MNSSCEAASIREREKKSLRNKPLETHEENNRSPVWVVKKETFASAARVMETFACAAST